MGDAVCMCRLTTNRFTRDGAAKYVHDSKKLIRDHTPPSKA